MVRIHFKLIKIFLLLFISSTLMAEQRYNPMIPSGFQDYDVDFAITSTSSIYSSNSDKLDGYHATEFALQGLWEIDANNNIMPSNANNLDNYWQVDIYGNLESK